MNLQLHWSNALPKGKSAHYGYKVFQLCVMAKVTEAKTHHSMAANIWLLRMAHICSSKFLKAPIHMLCVNMHMVQYPCLWYILLTESGASSNSLQHPVIHLICSISTWYINYQSTSMFSLFLWFQNFLTSLFPWQQIWLVLLTK